MSKQNLPEKKNEYGQTEEDAIFITEKWREYFKKLDEAEAEVNEVSKLEGELMPNELGPLTAFDINAIED